jgi:hypothetical protein
MANGSSAQAFTQPEEVVGLLQQDIVVSGVWPSRGGVWVTDLSHSPRAMPELASAGGVDEAHDLIAGQSSASRGRDGVVVDASNGAVRWTAPGWQLGRFSADGSYVVGYRLLGQDVRLGIFHASSGQLVRTEDGLVDPAIADPAHATAWEDDQHLLTLAESEGAQAVVRVPVSGALTRATRVVRVAQPGEHDFAFSARP